MADVRTGRCLCGAVRYRALQLRDIWFCHCRQCRYATGHFMAACRTEREKLEWRGDVVWSGHSGTSQMGRCADCGSPLFWRQSGAETISVVAGSLDDTMGLATPGHIFTGEAGAYYRLADGLPQSSANPEGGC